MSEYGLMPWHTERLTADEVNEIVQHMNAVNKARTEAHAEANRRRR